MNGDGFNGMSVLDCGRGRSRDGARSGHGEDHRLRHSGSNTLGVGFLEKVYENALCVEMRRQGLDVIQQAQIAVFYEGVEVGRYSADFIVERRVIVELKVARLIDTAHEAQLLNYLRATGLEAGLLLNFGTPRMGVRRMHL